MSQLLVYTILHRLLILTIIYDFFLLLKNEQKKNSKSVIDLELFFHPFFTLSAPVHVVPAPHAPKHPVLAQALYRLLAPALLPYTGF